MKLALDFTRGGLRIATSNERDGSDYHEKEYPFDDAELTTEAIYNEWQVADSVEKCPNLLAFVEQCLDKELGITRGNTLYFLLPDSAAKDGATEIFRQAMSAASKKYGEAEFLQKAEALSAWVAADEKFVERGQKKQFALLIFDNGLSVHVKELSENEGGQELVTKLEKSVTISPPESGYALLREALGTAASRSNDTADSDVDPKMSAISAALRENYAEVKDRLEFWTIFGESNGQEQIMLTKFAGDSGRKCTLLPKDLSDAYERLESDISLAVGTNSLQCKVLVYGADYCLPFLENAVKRALSLSDDQFLERDEREYVSDMRKETLDLALKGALAIAQRRAAFAFEIEQDIGVKAYAFEGKGDSVIVKPRYITLVHKGESSAQYSSQRMFDEREFRVEDANSDLVFFFRDDEGRVHELPLQTLSSIAKRGESVRLGFKIEGRQMFLIIANAADKDRSLRLSLSHAISMSNATLSIKIKGE